MRRLINHYLLANYGAGVQLSNVENERTFIVANVLVAFQCMYLYLSFIFFIFYRDISYAYHLLGIVAVSWFIYKVVQPAYRRHFDANGLSKVYRELPRGARAVYAVIGCTLTLGGLILIFAVLLFHQHRP